ncbi:putative mitochondrial transporter UCP3 isoform X2 [Tiliqua scincoides]|uniref:putative mitochondrial transporter UCP3 isoform X2 n=1 Tax=Tiliqua scincoides TaxID=71010 RepID=UPI0034632A1E
MVGLKPTDIPPSATVKFFSAGTAACIADLCTFPLDTAKVRLQIQGESKASKTAKNVKYRGVFGTIATMVKTEGPRSLYNGLVAGLQRQMSFASIRIGLYDSVKQFYTPKGSDNTSIFTRLLAGCTTGAMAVTCAQPTDVVKVRFQAHISVVGGPKKYNGTVDAYRTIAREEGFRGLWKDNFPCHFVAAFGAGFCATVVASPVDVVKTRYMNSIPGQYKNALNCTLTMVMKEGPTAFYKGFMPSFLRLGSWNVVMFVSFEQLKRLMVLAQVAWEFPF